MADCRGQVVCCNVADGEQPAMWAIQLRILFFACLKDRKITKCLIKVMMPGSDTCDTVPCPDQKIIILIFKGMKTATNVMCFSGAECR